MKDPSRTNQELIEEIAILQQRIRELEQSESECKRAEEELRSSEAFLNSIIENSPGAMWISDSKGTLIRLNQACRELLRITDDEVVGKYNILQDTIVREQGYLPLVKQVFEKGISAKFTIKYDSNQLKTLDLSHHVTVVLNVTITPIRDTTGRIINATIQHIDITPQRRAEEACRTAEARYRALFEYSPNGILLIDTETGKTIEANETASKQLGFTREELAALRISDYEALEKPEETVQHIQKVIRDGSDDFETLHRTKSGEIRNVHVWVKTVRSSDRSFFYAIFQDITEQKHAEEQLHHTLDSLRKAVNTTIQVMVSAIDVRDPYTAGHQIRSADLARAIATEMGLPQEKIDAVRMAGTIHDIGKLAIPAEVLSKPTKLMEIEFQLIQEHARRGFDMLKDVESPWPLAEIIYQHHERMDGSGYPRKLKGEEILIEARILAVADVVEAMASHRPYRAALGLDAALVEIETNNGICYDNAVADACLKLFREKGFQFAEK